MGQRGRAEGAPPHLQGVWGLPIPSEGGWVGEEVIKHSLLGTSLELVAGPTSKTDVSAENRGICDKEY